jgi:hypothetical protein
LFKLDAKAPKINVVNNVIRADGRPASYGSIAPPPASKLGTCTGNTILWTGKGKFPWRSAWETQCPDTQIIELGRAPGSVATVWAELIAGRGDTA